MGEIRIFEEAHIRDVAAMELKIFHGKRQPAGPELQKYFDEIFFRNPWRDDDLRSFVYIHKDRVVGFLGVIPRRMVFRERPIRVAVASQFMVDAEEYRGLAGLELIRRFFGGPQDLSVTDGATEAAHAVWTAAGASAAPLHSFWWTRVLRPFGHCRDLLKNRPNTSGGLLGAVSIAGPACKFADAVLGRIPIRALAAPKPVFSSHDADAEELLPLAEDLWRREPLRPCYAPEAFRWLMAQAAAARAHGVLRQAVVTDPSGSPAGWYAYYFKRGGQSTVLYLGAQPRHFEEVLKTLLADAWRRGSTAVSGQAIPRFLLSLERLRCGFHYVGNGVLVHSRNPELLAGILQGEATLSRLDGEWWTRFAVGDWH